MYAVWDREWNFKMQGFADQERRESVTSQLIGQFYRVLSYIEFSYVYIALEIDVHDQEILDENVS